VGEPQGRRERAPEKCKELWGTLRARRARGRRAAPRGRAP